MDGGKLQVCREVFFIEKEISAKMETRGHNYYNAFIGEKCNKGLRCTFLFCFCGFTKSLITDCYQNSGPVCKL
jgi:hypothetical protein